MWWNTDSSSGFGSLYSGCAGRRKDSDWDPGSGWGCSQIWRSGGLSCIDRAVPSLVVMQERGQAKRYQCSCRLASSTRGGRGCPLPAGGLAREPC